MTDDEDVLDKALGPLFKKVRDLRSADDRDEAAIVAAEVQLDDVIARVRRARFRRMAAMIYGEKFGAMLARALGVSHGMISHIVVGRRPVTDDLEDRMLRLADDEMGNLTTRAGQLIRKTREARELREIIESHAQPKVTPDPDDDGPAPSM